MALFGAPTALEDHAIRACLAALDIHREAGLLAQEVKRRDGITLDLRVGLNSGRVIAGAVGSGPLSYTAIGEQVGMAQRMESAAPPGGVMLSESTARLVERSAVLGETELVRIKGRDDPVAARRLLRVEPQRADRVAASLVGRRWEMTALDGMLERVLQGRGAVVASGAPLVCRREKIFKLFFGTGSVGDPVLSDLVHSISVCRSVGSRTVSGRCPMPGSVTCCWPSGVGWRRRSRGCGR